MFDSLPDNALDALDWSIDQYQPYLDDLLAREISADNVERWLKDWSGIGKLAYEVFSRIQVATTVDTTDEQAEQRLNAFLDGVYPVIMTTNNQLNSKLLASGLAPEGFEIPLRNIRAEVELFREENIPLEAQQTKLGTEYDKVIGAQTVEWDGEEKTLTQIRPFLKNPDRAVREKAWNAIATRSLQDREGLNDLWVQLMDLRKQIAANADQPDYRAYQWKAMKRFDYTPEDAESFHRAIETVAVPAAKRIYEKRRQQLGLETLRPWDVDVDPQGREPIKPYETIEELNATLETIFNQVDPALGAYFKTMREENLLDLDNRKGKAPGGYCTDFPLVQRPFIFMNAVGLHDDVQTLLHEGGHSFHVFETAHLPYLQQLDIPMEFAEVASMSMELLGAPYLTKESGGFYTEEEAARARVEHLESSLLFWPYMAVVDAFQHWAYTHHDEASNPLNCDVKWSELWDRFMPGIDYSGFDDVKATGWHRKLHIFQVPFYYIEYGLAQLGAVQVWASALADQARTVKNYRHALALGGTVTLPELFGAAGANFGFDTKTLSGAVDLMEKTIAELDTMQ